MQVLAIPCKRCELLVPLGMVAEVVGRVPVAPAVLDIRGFAGVIHWNGCHLPLFRTSELMGGAASDDQGYRQTVVLWPMKSAGNRSYMALTSLGTSKVIPVGELAPPEEHVMFPWALACAAMPEGLGVIPDLEALALRAWHQDRELWSHD